MRTNRKFRRLVGAVAILLGAAIISTACGAFDEYATSTTDQHICVFDGSERGGQKLKFQVPPGAESKRIDENDKKVSIPASNRFWNVASDRNIADPGTPNNYYGNAAGGVPVIIEGQIRFKFNLDLACEWYSKHGRRNAGENGNLGFNTRGDAQAGWFRFLNENFTVTMQEVVSESMGQYKWNYLHYNFPGNAGDDGIVPAGTEPSINTRQRLGEELGIKFTERLKANLGDDYFCGITPDGDNPCPAIEFQVSYAGPGSGSQLVKDRERVENTRQNLESSRLEGQLQQEQLAATLAAEEANAKVLEAKAANAERQARIDTAKCRALASQGLDCEGHRPQPILAR